MSKHRKTTYYIKGLNPILELVKHQPKRLIKIIKYGNYSSAKLNELNFLCEKHSIPVEKTDKPIFSKEKKKE